MCRELLRFRLLAFYLTLDQAFLLLFFVGLAVRFLFFRTYGLYTKPVAVVHEARRNIQVENKNNRSARKHKRQTSRKHRRLASKRLEEIQRDLKGSRNLKGCREIYKFSIDSKGLKGIRKDLQRFTEIEKDMKGDLKRFIGIKRGLKEFNGIKQDARI